MKNIFLNSTYPNSISFSDLLVTVWFDINVLILHSKENFSVNLIFFIIFVVLSENKSICPFSSKPFKFNLEHSAERIFLVLAQHDLVSCCKSKFRYKTFIVRHKLCELIARTLRHLGWYRTV